MRMDWLLGPEGWLSICLTHIWLTISSVKRNVSGTWCLSYHILFSRLTVLFPKKSCWMQLQRLMDASDNNGHGVGVGASALEAPRTKKKLKSSQKRKQLQQQQAAAVTSTVVSGEEWIERCQCLELDSYDGHMLMALHYQIYPMGLKLWDDLDTAWVLTLSSVASVLILRNLSAFFRALFSTSGTVMESQLQHDRSGITLIHLLLLFALGQLLRLAYKCSTPVKPNAHTSTSTKSVRGRLTLFSYWAGITTGLVGMLVTFPSSSTTNDGSSDNPVDWNLFQDGMNLKPAMEELSVRLLLLVRWFLCSSESEAFVQQLDWWLTTLVRISHALLIAFVSLAITLLATPIFETWQMAIPLFLLPPNYKKTNNDKQQESPQPSSFLSHLHRLYIKAVIIAMIILPILFMTSYMLPLLKWHWLQQLSSSIWDNYGYDAYALIRAVLGWLFCGLTLTILSTGFLRKHCQDAVTQVLHGPLISTKPFTQNDIHGPFRRQFQTLVSTASHLSCFPLWIILLLTAAHLHHPTTLTSNHHPSCKGGINLDLTNPSFITTTSSLHNCVIQPHPSSIPSLPPKECWLRSTPIRDKLQTFLAQTEKHFLQTNFCNLPTLSNDSNLQDIEGEKITSLELLHLAPKFKLSMYQSLRSILFTNQRSTITDNNHQPCDARDVLRHSWYLILEHCIFTSSVLFPMIETIAFMTCAVWVTLSLPIVSIYSYSVYQSHQKKKRENKQR